MKPLMRRTHASVALTLLALACTDQGPSGEQSSPLPPAPFVVSNPVVAAPSASPAQAVSRFTGLEMAYVSLPPGTLPDGRTTSVRNLRTNDSVVVIMVDGGFDPVALAAQAGDTIETRIESVRGGRPTLFWYQVPASSRPRVIRTDPPAHKRDVPLNGIIVIVFSEPIDGGTLTGVTVQLRQGSTVLSGQLQFTDSAHTSAELIPTSPLVETTDYVLDITQGIHDLDGDDMAAAVSVPFTTVTPGVPLPAAPFLLSRPLLWHSKSWTIFTALPGTTESDAWVSMTNVRTGEAGSLSMDAGGLDPFAFPAIVGDSFVITVRSIVTGDIQSYGAVVPATSTPQVVKSTPAAGQQDVWLGSSVEVEFSEPIAGDTFVAGPTSAVQLRRNGLGVGGEWRPQISASWLGSFHGTFVPSTALTSAAAYELVLTPAIQGAQGGEPLAGQIGIPFSTETVAPGPSDAVLTVESFTMIEYQYPSDSSGQKYYAPQLQLAETRGLAGVSVREMVFSVPGLGSTAPICSTGTAVAAGQSEAMFGIAYGEYEISFEFPGRRAGPGQATVSIIYRDEGHRTDTLMASAPITLGGLPSVSFANQTHSYDTLNCTPLFSPPAAHGPVFLQGGQADTIQHSGVTKPVALSGRSK